MLMTVVVWEGYKSNTDKSSPNGKFVIKILCVIPSKLLICRNIKITLLSMQLTNDNIIVIDIKII